MMSESDPSPGQAPATTATNQTNPTKQRFCFSSPATWLLTIIILAGAFGVWVAACHHILLAFLPLTYAFLAIGLTAIWFGGSVSTFKTATDPEEVSRQQILASIIILAMASILSAIALLAYGMSHPDQVANANAPRVTDIELPGGAPDKAQSENNTMPQSRLGQHQNPVRCESRSHTYLSWTDPVICDGHHTESPVGDNSGGRSDGNNEASAQ